MSDLLDDLKTAQRAADRLHDCRACSWLRNEPPGDRREAVMAGLASTIGHRKLADILRKHDIPVGRDHIALHRKEGPS